MGKLLIDLKNMEKSVQIRNGSVNFHKVNTPVGPPSLPDRSLQQSSPCSDSGRHFGAPRLIPWADPRVSCSRGGPSPCELRATLTATRLQECAPWLWFVSWSLKWQESSVQIHKRSLEMHFQGREASNQRRQELVAERQPLFLSGQFWEEHCVLFRAPDGIQAWPTPAWSCCAGIPSFPAHSPGSLGTPPR